MSNLNQRLVRISALIFTFLTLFIAKSQAGDCYSILAGDTLKIGNSRIERVYEWNNGLLKTCRIIDKKSGKVFTSQNNTADFSINREKPKNASYCVKQIPSDGIKPAHLLTVVNFMLGDLEVERNYRIYDGVPAIATDTRLKGNLNGIPDKDIENSDRSNIEHAEDMKVKPVTATLDRISLAGNHWKCRTVEFLDITDWNDNLVFEKDFITYRKTAHKGNIMTISDMANGGGLVFLKEAPCSSVQLENKNGDFISDFGTFMIIGPGIGAKDVTSDKWTDTYSSVVCTFDDDELSALKSLREYQKQCRILDPERDEMIMMNTWGDRSQDSKVNEQFCLAELEKAAKLGITVFQIDDGWQSGKSPNSKTAGGSFKDIYANKSYWSPDPIKYPRGLKPIVKRGNELGIKIGLWFNPSVQNDFEDWEKDAATIIGLWKDYGIKIFKIDGITINNKKGEENLRKLFDKVLQETNNEIIFNLDATASRRMGYHYFNEYGNVFLENRYTDWGNYYPFHTLRNLWMLSKYVPAEKLQVEFLNNWRNVDKYPDDPFAPANYNFEYLFAITMAGQPLAWMEASNLPKVAFSIKPLVEKYKEIQHDFHKGVILPIGEEPSGKSWTGFQSIVDETSGYILVFRENNNNPNGEIKTWNFEGAELEMIPIVSSESDLQVINQIIDKNGNFTISLKQPNSFALYQYKLLQK